MQNWLYKIFQRPARWWRDERGVQLVEAAIVLPIFLILLAVAAEFGRYFYVYSTLSRATRTAVRHISSKEFKGTTATEAKNLALCGTVANCVSGTEILSGLTAANFEITPPVPPALGSTNFPTTVTVRVTNYTYQPIFNLGNFAEGVSWANVPIQAKTTMRYMLAN
jgi:Flp pilus assembly protein TadG